MSIKGCGATLAVAVFFALALSGCGNSTPYSADVLKISFLTDGVPDAQAGLLYNVVIAFEADGGAAMPDRFELVAGVLPTGVTLERDREDTNFDGLPDADGDYTGNARLLGVPRQRGSYSFTIKAISTGELGSPLAAGVPNPEQPDLAVTHAFSVNVSEGTIAILTPTEQEGTSDPAVPHFPGTVPFVNPANPDAFLSFAFQIAGGSNNNHATIYAPREWELSAFDISVLGAADPDTALHVDVDESAVPGAPPNMGPFEQNIADGGIFVIQGGQQRVQIGGFQSPRGPVRSDGPDAGEDITSSDPPFMEVGGVSTLLSKWFQDPAVPQNSRRDFGDSLNLAGGDNTLGAENPIIFSDYFAPGFKSTTPTPVIEAKYPFVADQYLNAFFVPYTVGVDLTPLAYRLIVEAIDTRGTITDKTDDVIARKAYTVRVQIPDIGLDTVVLASGRAGELYAAQIALSGGVPPLFAELEWVDGGQNGDLAPTNDALTKDMFGIDLDPRTWQFVGLPRAAGDMIELTVRAYAQVMNPQQAGKSQPPLLSKGPGDKVGLLTLPDGVQKAGVHRTYRVAFAEPTVPVVSNTSLKAGLDGQPYGGDTLKGMDGVARMFPYPVGFFEANPGASFPLGAVRYAYDFAKSAPGDPVFASGITYDQDASYTPPATGVEGLPNALVVDVNPFTATNGNITGTAYDRGFFAVHIMGRDFYAGKVGDPVSEDANRQMFQKMLSLSVGPDEVTFLSGVKSTEGSGGTANGLAADDQMTEQRMVPLLLAAGLFKVESGKTRARYAGLPTNFDTLPVLMPNGGSDSHNTMSKPQVRGFWPAESNKELQWPYYYGYGTDRGWNHLQQEFTWLQAPDDKHRRVFMWAEATTVKVFNTPTTWTIKYQQLDVTKKRGTFVLDPTTGGVHVPAILDPSTNANHGLTFGAEVVLGTRDVNGTVGNTSSSYSYFYYECAFYTHSYYYYPIQDTRVDREVHLHGTNTYIYQIYSGSGSYGSGAGYYMTPQGRTGTSVAMSADGKWCATALAGPYGTGQKILLWRTDNQPVPFMPAFAEGVEGVDEDGTTKLNATSPASNPGFRAIILKIGGQVAGTVALSNDQQHLLPDSLMFVENGLLFLNATQLDRVFGVSLVDGHLSSVSLNSRTGVGAGGVSSLTVSSVGGQYVPDNDKLNGAIRSAAHGAQFSFAGNKPAAGEEGPKKVAFVAGVQNLSAAGQMVMLTDTYLSFSTHPRHGYAQVGNTNKMLLFMDLNTTGATGLDLAGTGVKDLTGNSANIYGDLLTPGRFGEELDRLVLSDDGRYAAVVREWSISTAYSTYYGYYGCFGTSNYYYMYHYTYSSGSESFSPSDYYNCSQDLLVVSTDGTPMHTGGQHVLFLGTGYVTDKAKGGMPGYAVQQAHLNADLRRIFGLQFAPDGEHLILNYAAGGKKYQYSGSTYSYTFQYSPNSPYYGATYWYSWNPSYIYSTTYGYIGTEMSVSLKFRNGANPENFVDKSNVTNNLKGLTGISGIGQTTAPFGDTDTSQQCFWSNFKSENGAFMYYISDQIDTTYASAQASNRNFMVGFNITAAPIGASTALSPLRDPFTPFITHPNTVGFEQFECNAWNYENRFAASPRGLPGPDGLDSQGILCVIGSDSSAGAGSATDLEVYAMDANLGTDLSVLTAAVTPGTANAINHLYLSCDGNVIAGQVANTTVNSGSNRTTLTNNSYLFAVTNIHDVVYNGALPNAFRIAGEGTDGTGAVQAGSYGATVAFIGDGTLAGPQAMAFSSAPAGTSNSSWVDRRLKSVQLIDGATPTVLDTTQSHSAVLSGGRKVADNPTNGN